MKKFFSFLFFVVLSLMSHPSNAETNAYPILLEDKVFFEKLQKAAVTNDVHWFSGAVSYPLVVRLDSGSLKLKNEADFVKHAARILTPEVRLEISKQSADSLFKNWQGVKIGNGVLWFSQVNETSEKKDTWIYRIVGINPQTDSSTRHKSK